MPVSRTQVHLSARWEEPSPRWELAQPTQTLLGNEGGVGEGKVGALLGQHSPDTPLVVGWWGRGCFAVFRPVGPRSTKSSLPTSLASGLARKDGLGNPDPLLSPHSAWVAHLVPYRFPENSACSMKSPAAMSRCITSLVTK